MSRMTVKNAKTRISYTSPASPLFVLKSKQKGSVEIFFYNTITSRLIEKQGKDVIGVFHSESDLSKLGNRL
jgi:hypothetical protein